MSLKAKAVVAEAKKYLGTPYAWGGASPGGFDCSGFVQYCYKKVGVSLPRTTYDQINCGIPVKQNNLKVGDLVFPHTGHVGIYVGKGKMIHSPQSNDVVRISNITRFYAGRRVA